MRQVICRENQYVPGWSFGRVTRQHVAVVERALGKRLPQGADVHHIDGDRKNNAPTNLVVCESRAYHMLLHLRARALAATGNPAARKCRYCRQWDSPKNLRTAHRKAGGYEVIYHADCARANNRKRHRARVARRAAT